MQIKQQPMINYNYKWFTGAVLSNPEIDGYNTYTVDLNRTTDTETRDFLMDQRHKYLVLCLDEVKP
jgi:hypothetical protein